MFGDTLNNTLWTVRGTVKKNKANIWKAVLRELSKSRSNKREINVGRLANVTNDNDVIIVPGKILGTGDINHKLTVWSLSLSEVAAKKIINSGGKLISLDNLIEKYPTGRGIKIIA